MTWCSPAGGGAARPRPPRQDAAAVFHDYSRLLVAEVDGRLTLFRERHDKVFERIFRVPGLVQVRRHL
jgi:hypothetical protein